MSYQGSLVFQRKQFIAISRIKTNWLKKHYSGLLAKNKRL